MDNTYFYRHSINVSITTPSSIILYMIKLIEQKDFKYMRIDDVGNKIIYGISQINEMNIFKEAQFRKVQKFTTKKRELPADLTLHPKIIYYEGKKNFLFNSRNNFLPEMKRDAIYNINLISKKEKTQDLNTLDYGLGLFSESEIQSLEYKILSSIELDKEVFMSFLKEEKISYDEESVRLKLSETRSLIEIYEYFNFIEVMPLHYSNYREKISYQNLFSVRYSYSQIRNYYGDKIAIYYAWMNTYQKWLSIPAIYALLIWIIQRFFEYEVTFFYTTYALLMGIWSQMFLRSWDRKCSELTIEWDNFTTEYDKENVRSDFVGEIRKSPITEKEEKFFPKQKRIYLFIMSGIRAIPYLCFALFTMVCFLNLTGVIKEEDKSVLEIEFLNRLAQKGGWLDSHTFVGTIICIMQPIVILFINKQYRKVAIQTTINENHQIKSTFENSLIIKRFIFEFFDGFICLFYLAFFHKDRNYLKSTLKSFFISNQIRRLLTESVIPCVIGFFKGTITKNNILLLEDDNKLQVKNTSFDKYFIIHQMSLSEYELFDDYLEGIIEFGYLTLFAECFPFASVMIFVFSFIEMRSDLFKLGTLFKKPHIQRKRNIGIWNLIMKSLSILCVFTNTLLYIISIDLNFEQEHPELKGKKIFGNMIKNQREKYSHLMLFFIIEHAVLIAFVLLSFIYSAVPYWVNIFHSRREYKIKGNRWVALLEGMKDTPKTN